MGKRRKAGEIALPARLRARARGIENSLTDDDAQCLVAFPPAWCRACRADLLEAARESEAMREALEFVLEFVGRQTRFYREDAVFARVVLHVEAVLSGAGIEGSDDRS